MPKKTAEQKQLPRILTDAGFIRLDKQPDGGYHAIGAEDFGKAHANAVKGLGNRAACRRQNTINGPILIVEPIAVPEPETAEPKPQEPAVDE
jgi:hypothetical protein